MAPPMTSRSHPGSQRPPSRGPRGAAIVFISFSPKAVGSFLPAVGVWGWPGRPRPGRHPSTSHPPSESHVLCSRTFCERLGFRSGKRRHGGVGNVRGE